MTPFPDTLRACGIFVPADNSDPAGNGDGTSGGIFTVNGRGINTNQAGWRKALVDSIQRVPVQSTPPQPATTPEQYVYSMLKR